MGRTVFANSRNFSHSGSGDKSLSSAPDVCKTPVGTSTPPLPYMVMSQAGDLGDGTTSVKIDGNSTAIANSKHSKCTGDEPGTAKGVASSTTKGESKFTTYSFDVKAEGKGVVRHMDMTTMNKMNTIGMVLGSMTSPSVIPDEEPEPWDFETEPKTLIIRVNLPPSGGQDCEDTYILRSIDGSYESSKTVSDDMIAGDDYLDLLFEELEQNQSYSLEHVPVEGDSWFIFEDVRYLALRTLS